SSLSRGRSSALALSSPVRSCFECDERARADLHQARTEPLAYELMEEGFAEAVRGAKARNGKNVRWHRQRTAAALLATGGLRRLPATDFVSCHVVPRRLRSRANEQRTVQR